MVSFHQVSKHYADQEVLRDISLQVNPGDKVGLIGANGTGKTTLLHVLRGAQQPSAGMVVADPDVKIGFVPQQLDAAATVQVRDYLLGEVASAERALRGQQSTPWRGRPRNGWLLLCGATRQPAIAMMP